MTADAIISGELNSLHGELAASKQKRLATPAREFPRKTLHQLISRKLQPNRSSSVVSFVTLSR